VEALQNAHLPLCTANLTAQHISMYASRFVDSIPMAYSQPIKTGQIKIKKEKYPSQIYYL
jgi:hypothetical protein